LIFRDALRAVTPYFDRARIPWREPDAYDDWDMTVDVLFKVIVVDSIRWALKDVEDSLKIPKYGMTYQSYAKMSFLALRGERTPQYLAVRSLATRVSPFDFVECVLIDPGGDLVEKTPRCEPFDTAHFEFQHRLPGGRLKRVDSLRVLT
jgi:hypothetical protein